MKHLPIGATAIVLLSLVMTILAGGDPSPDRMIDWGAKSTAAMTESGEWWRLLTAALPHHGPLHWLLNAALILGFGGAIEMLFKRGDALLVYVTTALSTTIASSLANDGVAYGASGIALGCLACTTTYTLRFYHSTQPRERFLLLAATLPTAITYLAGGFLVAGVDNAGHLAGAATGVLFGLGLDGERAARLPWIPVGAIVCISLVAGPSVEWKPLYKDGVKLAIPATFTATSPQTYENTLGTTVVIEASDGDVERYKREVLDRFAEVEEVRSLRLGEARAESMGGKEAVVLPLFFEGPRGRMVGWHVWVAGLHAVWTARAKRAAQNEALFRTWVQHFSFSS